VKVYRDQATAYSTERLHPYHAMDDSQSGFVDFVQHPDQIPIALEDFRPFGDRSAVQTFYDFLRWLNGRDGHLQSCDCAFRPAASHADTNSHYTLSAIGRLFIMFRDLRFNCSNPHTEWLCDRLMHYLTEVDQDMSVAEGVVGFTLNPVLHLDLAQGFWRPTGEYDVAADSPGKATCSITWSDCFATSGALAVLSLMRSRRHFQRASRSKYPLIAKAMRSFALNKGRGE
jgi:hypothetical protein